MFPPIIFTFCIVILIFEICISHFLRLYCPDVVVPVVPVSEAPVTGLGVVGLAGGVVSKVD